MDASVRQCSRCQRQLPVAEFVRRTGAPSGMRGVCKQCERIRHRERFDRDRPTKEQYRLTHRAQLAEKRQREHLAKRGTPKHKARDILRHAVIRGQVSKPSACDRCGLECNPHGHHQDYSLPLNVEWLCAVCHGAEHRISEETHG